MKDSTFMAMAVAASSESKCVRLKVGSVLVKDNRVLSSGYNGTPAGYDNCCDVVGISVPMEDHHHWSQKYEIHSEMNCMMQCPVEVAGATMFVTDSPCFNCTKHMIAAGIKRIVYGKLYDRYLAELSHEWDEVLEFCVDNNVVIEKL
jgi:dCMP deaminase